MNPLNSWLDADEVRRLANRLMKPVRNPAMTLSDIGFDEQFIGFAESSPARPNIPADPNTGEPELPTPVAKSPTPPPLPQPQPPVPSAGSLMDAARGPFLNRIQRFRDWMRQNFSATGVFLLDREGSVIFDESDHGRLHFLARSLAHASSRENAPTRNVHVKIGAGATLEVIPVETAYGRIILGAVVPQPLGTQAITAIDDALKQVATPPKRTASPAS